MNLGVKEIIRRSEQGTTRPFLCRGEDESLYYVKGRYAGRRSLVCEWVAGRLGRLLNLPIPEIVIAEVPEALVRFSAMPDISDLGSGPVFGSQAVEDAQEFAFSDISRVPEILRFQVLLFDWWIYNEDRTLTEYGGNPNLVWSAERSGLQVFDQNLAFEDFFDSAGFWRQHVFNPGNSSWPLGFRQEMEPKMTVAVTDLPRIWEELPHVWLHEDGDRKLPACLNFEEISRLLHRFQNDADEFWRIPT